MTHFLLFFLFFYFLVYCHFGFYGISDLELFIYGKVKTFETSIVTERLLRQPASFYEISSAILIFEAKFEIVIHEHRSRSFSHRKYSLFFFLTPGPYIKQIKMMKWLGALEHLE